MTNTSRVVVTGTWNRPELRVYFNPHQEHLSAPDKTLSVWMEEYILGSQRGQGYWTGKHGCWTLFATGPNPERKFAQAGFEIDYSETPGTTLEAVMNLDELVTPITRLTPDGRSALILSRLLGYEATKDALGFGAHWDREFKRFVMPVSDAMHKGSPRPGILWEPNILEASRLSLGRVITNEDIAGAVASAGAAKDVLEMDASDVAKLIETVGDVPDWFGLDLFPFQRIGAIAVAAGHFGLFDEPGLGKASAVSEPVLTPGGWKNMGDIELGDEVIGADGRPTKVLGVFQQGEKEIAKTTFTDGSWTRTTWDHLWSVTTSNDRSRGSEPRVLTTRELLEKGLMAGGKRQWQIPMVKPVHFAASETLQLDPYLIGALLGDGYMGRNDPTIATDEEIANSLILPPQGSIVPLGTIAPGVGEFRINGLNDLFRDAGLLGHRAEGKSIPREYQLASVPDRIALLQGLLDTDGSNVIGRAGGTSSTVEYGTVSEQLAQDLLALVQSLGGTASIGTKIPTYSYLGEARTGQKFYRMVISLPTGITPFRLARKLERWTPRTKYEPSRRIESIEADGSERAQCIRVEASDHLYVTRSFIVTHNTRQTIAAASILGSERTLITCLPVGLTGWKNEVTESLLHTLGGKNPDGEVVVIRAGKKEPKTLPDKGVIITSDSLLTSRPELLARILEWQPEVFGYDEAHRGKTFESARSRAMLKISAATKKAPIPITGTPLFANPSELAPLLEFSGHLGPVFGGLNAYLDRYCKPAHFGGWNVRKENLPELRAKLSAHVWVRRRKRDVLPDLPKTLLVPKYVDVPLTEYKRAHKDVIVKLSKWVDDFRKMNDGNDPDVETIREFASSQVGLVSLLRRAAGVAKVPALVADIQTHVADTTEVVNGQKVFTRPLIVWAHHRDVTDALAEALPAAVAETGIIRGGVAHAERDRLVSEFQAHRIPVLICSIAAAGVAITLTASSDSFFAESDWTPATVRQALDRAERIGQTSDKLMSTTYLAEGTLDFRIQQILKEKSKVLDAIYGDGNDVSVDGERSDVESSTDLLVNALQMILRGEANVL